MLKKSTLQIVSHPLALFCHFIVNAPKPTLVSFYLGVLIEAVVTGAPI
jgi:hypothetical protein